MKRFISIVLVFVMIFNLVGCDSTKNVAKNVKGKTEKVVEDIVDTAKDGYSATSDFVKKQTEKAKQAISELSFPDFQKGFETAASFFGSTVASLGGENYIKKVADEIKNLEDNIFQRVNSGPIESNAGNLAEEWHAGTFNIDAIAKDIKTRASTGKSNGLASPDISLTDGTEASVKYYKDAKSSAQQQAKNYIQRYNEYARDKENPLSMDEWLTSNGKNIAVDDQELYWSIYKDQVRIIPANQLDDVISCLEKSINYNATKEGANRKFLTDSDQETLKNLTDRLKSADGAESVPLTKVDAEAIAKAAQEGNFTAAEFGITVGSAIKGSYIAKQALKSGTSSGIIEAAIVLGPEIYEIIRYGIEDGNIDEEQLKTAGIDGLSAAGDSFLKGSISNALVIMCQSGNLGLQYTNPSPELISAATVLVIDAIRYGIRLANGKITTGEYTDILAQEVIVCAGSLGSAALTGLMFPQASLAIMIGSFVGGLVVSAGYATGKTYVLALMDSSGTDILVPIKTTAETIKKFTESISIKLQDALSSLKNIETDAINNITIKVYDLKGII